MRVTKTFRVDRDMYDEWLSLLPRTIKISDAIGGMIRRDINQRRKLK